MLLLSPFWGHRSQTPITGLESWRWWAVLPPQGAACFSQPGGCWPFMAQGHITQLFKSLIWPSPVWPNLCLPLRRMHRIAFKAQPDEPASSPHRKSLTYSHLQMLCLLHKGLFTASWVWGSAVQPTSPSQAAAQIFLSSATQHFEANYLSTVMTHQRRFYPHIHQLSYVT